MTAYPLKSQPTTAHRLNGCVQIGYTAQGYAVWRNPQGLTFTAAVDEIVLVAESEITKHLPEPWPWPWTDDKTPA